MGAAVNNSGGVNYQALEAERLVQSRAALKQKLKSVSENDLGRSGSLRRRILTLVVSEEYDKGKEALLSYIQDRSRDYAILADRVEKFVKHAGELIQAIQTKRSFPGLGSLSLTKQQEISEKVLVHFQELKQTLKTIERNEKDLKLADMRSTSWTVLTFSHSLLLIVTVAFALSISRGMWNSFDLVFTAMINDFCDKLEIMMHWR